MAENQYADIWQKDIPAGVPFEVELREAAPKTIPMSKGGAFDKWKAGIPKSNPLHQGGDHEIEFVWLEVVSTSLKDLLRAHGQGRVTINKTLEGQKELFTLLPRWESAGATGGGNGDASSGKFGRAGRPLPEGETAAQFLAGLCRATAFAHNYLRDSSSVAAVIKSLDGEGHSSFESTLFIQAGKIALSASIAALDSGQDLNAQLRSLLRSSPTEEPSGPELPREPDPGEEEDNDLPF